MNYRKLPAAGMVAKEGGQSQQAGGVCAARDPALHCPSAPWAAVMRLLARNMNLPRRPPPFALALFRNRRSWT